MRSNFLIRTSPSPSLVALLFSVVDDFWNKPSYSVQSLATAYREDPV
jgi:hypothetical protein